MICLNNLPDHTARPYYLPSSQIRGIHMGKISIQVSRVALLNNPCVLILRISHICCQSECETYVDCNFLPNQYLRVRQLVGCINSDSHICLSFMSPQYFHNFINILYHLLQTKCDPTLHIYRQIAGARCTVIKSMYYCWAQQSMCLPNIQLRMGTKPVPKTLFFFEYETMDKVQKPRNHNGRLKSSGM